MSNAAIGLATGFAEEFSEILSALSSNPALQNPIRDLVAQQPMPGRVTEGGDRLARFRAILDELARGKIGFYQAFARVETEIPRRTSTHGRSNQVFAEGWAERLVRTQLSRFYNQAVMEHLLGLGHTRCFVPHSFAESPGTACSRLLAGREHDLKSLHQRLVSIYSLGQWHRSSPTVPEHPHCTHVVAPIR